MNASLLNKRSRSSKDRAGTGTTPKIPISTAPHAIADVPETIYGLNMSPSKMRAKKAFQTRGKAASGASIMRGNEASWKTEPRTFEIMNITACTNLDNG